jgi:hypothetical protein
MKRLHSPGVWIVLLLIAVAPPLLWFGWKDSSGGSPAGPASPADGSDSSTPYSRFEAGQRQIDERVWSRELLAEDCGRTVESLWDALNASPQRWTVVQAWAPGSIALGIWTPPISHPHGLSVQTSHPGGTTLAANAWRSQLREWELDGWNIGGVEFRHRAFDVNSRGLPDHSTFGFRADLLHPGRNERLTITGDLRLDWGGRDPATGLWQVRHVDASRLTLTGRRGPPPF